MIRRQGDSMATPAVPTRLRRGGTGNAGSGSGWAPAETEMAPLIVERGRSSAAEKL